MSDIKLFRINGKNAIEVMGSAGGLEKDLQVFIESNLETILGVRLLASEHQTGKAHAGRIDTLGIDENNCPVIIEYKRSLSENVINQGLFYLDWLLDHKAEFKFLVLECIGKDAAAEIDWSSPRLVCIAADFTRYDMHAVRQMDRNIDLLRYRRFGADLLAFELVHRTSDSEQTPSAKTPKPETSSKDKPVKQALIDAEPDIRNLFESLRAYIISLGDDVLEKPAKLYMIYKRIKNFACVVVQKKALLVFVKLDPNKVSEIEGLVRNVTDIGHWGTGNFELTIRNKHEMEQVLSLIQQSYEGT